MSARLRRLTGWLTLAAFFSVLSVPVLAGVHLAWNDDVACDGADLGPRHSNVLAEQHAPIESSHCAVCHWMRAVASATPRPAQTEAVSLAPLRSDPAVVVSTVGLILNLDQPSRAPPVSLPL